MLSPWIHFEAGGMIKGLGKSRVATVLLDIEITDLHQPLNLFNGLRLNRQGAWHLVRSFNNVNVPERRIKERVLERTFEKFWPDLDDDYRTLFPQAHRAAEEVAQPLHIPPKPSATVFGDPPAADRKKAKSTKTKSKDAEHARPGLFNGEKD